MMSARLESTAAPLLIVGASTRAAAFSARRAGFGPVCVDRFGDADLRAVARVETVSDYPGGIARALSRFAGLPALYVGAIENAPNVLDQLGAHCQLAGNPREVVVAVRDPQSLVDHLLGFGLPMLAVRSSDEPPPQNGHWVVKPARSAAGRRIARWEQDTAPLTEPHYFQEFAEGDSYSALFVAPPDRRDVRFVGLTRQWVGDPLLHAAPFGWCGSIGPETLPVQVEQLVRRIGNVLSWKVGLCGLFGIDFVLSPDGVPLLTEVNPRYTGSAEVLEHTLRLTLVRDHCASFGIELPASADPPPGVHAMGKFILYSPHDFEAPEPADWLLPEEWLHAEVWRQVPRIADVPVAGARIRRGEPVCTLYTVGETPAECLEQMPAFLQDIKQRLFGDSK